MSVTTTPRGVEVDWRARAACLGKPTRIWFSVEPIEQAIAVQTCRGCPVRAECLADAIDRGDSGIRGGVLDSRRAGALSA